MVAIAAWEIECCAPPPVVGEHSSWRLVFGPGGGHLDELDHDHLWQATAHDWGVVLTDTATTAYWRPADNAPDPVSAAGPGPVRVRGHLWGTVHGGHVPEQVPMIRGLVTRVQMITQRHQLRPGPLLTAVPGSLRLRDIHRSPRWFPRSAGYPDDEQPTATGVLLDLTVDPTHPT